MSPINLSAAARGTRGHVASLGTNNRHKLQKLLTMGILPGASLEVIQRFPAYVLGIGHTQVAIDDELARDIYFYPA